MAKIKDKNNLLKLRRETKNILNLETPGYSDDKKQLRVADNRLASYAQNLIDEIAEHRHLRTAKILLLVEHSDSTKKKLDRGEVICLGKASKANLKDKLLTAIVGKNCQADFFIKLSGNWMDMIQEADAAEDLGAGEKADERILALIDHELCHCSAKIAGEFIEPEEVEVYVKDLGDNHIETCRDVTDKDGKLLVRYYAKDKSGKLTFKMRKHDIEEFHGVVARHGQWSHALGRLIDVLVDSQKDQPLLNQKKASA